MSEKDHSINMYALKVHQWNEAWDEIIWNDAENRKKPLPWFYQFSIKAEYLRRLCGVYARNTNRTSASEDMGIQRQHESARSEEIKKFVEFGYPWSDLSERKRQSDDFRDLRQPGWLPTSLVVNILLPNDTRLGEQVNKSDLIRIEDSKDNNIAKIVLPEGFEKDDWNPSTIAPIEVIDGQHRLWAFEKGDSNFRFELPVVAFLGLDLSWQAYLFYTINIKPKKINTSLAFDLYPLLRTEKWLEKFEGHTIYRESRAQELVDKLWSYPDSPWHKRINMLGERGKKGLMVTQAAWVRSLLVSFIKSWEGRRVVIGGLYGSKVGEHKTTLNWNLSQQAAFLIFLGQKLQNAIRNSNDEWAESLRKFSASLLESSDPQIGDSAFFGQFNLLNQDQGIRIMLQVFNDFLFINADSINLLDWVVEEKLEDAGREDSEIRSAIASLSENRKISNFVDELSSSLATYDWRASGFPGLDEEQRTLKASFRGSGGYKDLRNDVLKHIKTRKTKLSSISSKIMDALGYL